MKTMTSPCICGRALLWLALLFLALPVLGKDSLVWRAEKNMVSAEITTWDLNQLLENVAEATGWIVYVEPDTTRKISSKFKERTPGDALKLLLGDLSFALLPRKNEPSRLYVFRTSVGEATQQVKAPSKAAAKKAKPIPDELIVTVKPGTDIEALAKKLGAKIIGRADALHTYRLKFEDEESARDAKEQLKSDSSVENIDYNFPISRPDPPEALGLSALPSGAMSLTPKLVPDANRIIIGLIDTAVQPKGTGLEGFFLPSLAVGEPGTPPADIPTHGDGMSGSAFWGMTKSMEGEQQSKVRFLNVDVYGNSPTTSSFDVAVGIYKAINAGAPIISMSLGSYGESSFLHNVIISGHQQGVIFFASAGNEPVTIPTYPAAYPEVIAVTAGDKQGLAPYANRGDFVDVIAPGTTLVNFRGKTWYVVGTSPSAAYLAGVAGGIMNQTGQAPIQVERSIRSGWAFKQP